MRDELANIDIKDLNIKDLYLLLEIINKLETKSSDVEVI